MFYVQCNNVFGCSKVSNTNLYIAMKVVTDDFYLKKIVTDNFLASISPLSLKVSIFSFSWVGCKNLLR